MRLPFSVKPPTFWGEMKMGEHSLTPIAGEVHAHGKEHGSHCSEQESLQKDIGSMKHIKEKERKDGRMEEEERKRK